jgi:dihydrofolate reductase
MGRIVVTEFVSVDGVMEAPGGEPGYAHSGWTLDVEGDDHFAYKLEELMESDVLLLGRVTYESFAGAWPDRDDEAGFAAKMNAMPKHVVSSTLDEVAWENSTLLEADVVESVRRLRADVDGMILVAGSRTLVHTLLQNDLVDELRLMVFPVVLGSGGRVFPRSERKLPLELADTRRYDSGVVVNVYRRRD